MQTALDILESFAEQTGWNTDSMLALICDYVDNQCSPEAFADFVAGAADDELNYEVQ